MSLITADRVRETTTTTGTGDITLAGAVSGYMTFASAMADQDTTLYCIANRSASEWETGIGTFNATPGTLTRTTVLTNSAGNTSAVTFSAGTKDVFITRLSTRLPLPEMTADPAGPASGNFFYTRQVGGRFLPRFIGPSGLDSAVQPAFFANSVSMWLVGTGATASINFGTSWTVTGTQATPTIASTNAYTQMRRAEFTTTTRTTGSAGIRSSAPVVWNSNVSGQGGFFFACRFGTTGPANGPGTLIGLSSLSTNLTVDPTTLTDSCGLITSNQINGNYYFLTADATTQNRLDTALQSASGGVTSVWDFAMFAPPNATSIQFRLDDVINGNSPVTWTSTSNLPASSAMLYAHAEYCNNGSTGVGLVFAIQRIYVESDI